MKAFTRIQVGHCDITGVNAMRPKIMIIVLLYKKSDKNERWCVTAIIVRGRAKERTRTGVR